ncbi:MAG: hypothetical protein KA224_04085 [Steroidobacteraceae bacterium]|nr:hypothetical protein [Steroidobacteraceae bacterium]
MTATQKVPFAEQLLARLPATPDVYAQKVDFVRGAVLLLQFDAAAYRSASFLDDRVLGPTTKGGWAGLDAVAAAAQRVQAGRPLHFIFHTGHVGSTLLSRLLEEAGGVLALREPLPLRSLAEAQDVLGQPESLLSDQQFAGALDLFLRLWSRGYEATRAVVVKATSSTGRLAPLLLGRQAGSRAVYLNLRAEPYLATLLAGANSPLDLRGHGPLRIRRLQARTAVPLQPLHALSLGELAAMSWLSETCCQHDALRLCPGRVLAVDFDALLGEVAPQLGRVLAHFGLPADADLLARLARSPVLGQYSKAPEHAYTPALRADTLRESRRVNAAEIARGLAYLERIAAADAALASAMAATTS